MMKCDVANSCTTHDAVRAEMMKCDVANGCTTHDAVRAEMIPKIYFILNTTVHELTITNLYPISSITTTMLLSAITIMLHVISNILLLKLHTSTAMLFSYSIPLLIFVTTTIL